jgi:hypothetical protein
LRLAHQFKYSPPLVLIHQQQVRQHFWQLSLAVAVAVEVVRLAAPGALLVQL